MIRTLSTLEQHCVNIIFEAYRSTGWEYSAFFDSSNGALIELLTEQNASGADPSQRLVRMARSGTEFIVHHNHPSQGSLSLSDWNGAATLNFREIFAHCEDGTVYWGTAANSAKLQYFFYSNPIDQRGERILVDLLCKNECFDDISAVAIFGREIANRAMKIVGYVDYEVSWGSTQSPSANSSAPTSVSHWAKKYESLIDEAAKLLAREI